MHRCKRDDRVVYIVCTPSHARNIISPEVLTGATADCIDSLRDEVVVERQDDVAHIEQGIITCIERTRGVAGHPPFEQLPWNTDTQQLLGGIAFAVDIGRLASLAFGFSLITFDAPFATRETAGLGSFRRHDPCILLKEKAERYRDPDRDVLTS